MEKIKTLKPGSVIRGIDISSSFYERLSSLFLDLAADTSDDDPERKFHLETLAILFNTLDEAAENQGLTEESDPKDAPF